MKPHRAASRPIVAVGLVFLSACGDETWPVGVGGGGGAGDAGTVAPGYAWALPEGFPLPVVPADNPMSAEKVKLGRYLFYDKRLSGNEQQSCADCHKQELAFTDGRATALGSTGQAHPRNAMSLANVGYASTLTWANRAALLAVGDPSAALDAVAWGLGQAAPARPAAQRGKRAPHHRRDGCRCGAYLPTAYGHRPR